MHDDAVAPLCVSGRYAVYEEIAAGGMATVHLGRQLGAAGFARTVAIKRLRPEAAADPDVLAMFIDEARLAARVRHPNVVSILDVVSGDSELLLVMEYVVGASLAALALAMRRLGERAPPEIVSSVVLGALHGVHAAHEATSEDGTPLQIVHRDISPHNVLVGIDGIARVLDFGVAKAAAQLHTTRQGEVRGKLAYMAPEQLRADTVTRSTDLYAMGVVLWELLAGQRLFSADNEGALLWRVLEGSVPRLREIAPHIGEAAATVAEQAIERDPARRFASAIEMARALDRALPPAPPAVVGGWVARVAAPELAARAALVARIERAATAPIAGAAATAPIAGAAATATAPVAARASRASPLPARGTRTLTAKAVQAPSRGRAVLPLALGALAIAAAAAGAAWAFRGAPPAEAMPQGSAVPPPGAPPERSSDAPSPGAASQEDAAEPAPQSERSAPGTLAASSAQTRSRSAAPARRPPPAASARSNGSPCDPPYYVDESGIQRVKRQCLR